MPPKKNPLKLNTLQLRTLVIAQVLAQEDEIAVRDEASGAITLRFFPQPHGDHFHVGKFTVPARAATGLFNDAVWKALGRKGLVDPNGPGAVTLTAEGVAYDTGLSEAFDEAERADQEASQDSGGDSGP
jgi:hypothetical protein